MILTMNNSIKRILLVFLSSLVNIFAKKLTILSSSKPNDGNIIYQEGSPVIDYVNVTIANDPISNLPEQFTVCNSLFIDFMTTTKNVVQIYKEDGTHWFHLGFSIDRDLPNRKEKIAFIYHTGKYII